MTLRIQIGLASLIALAPFVLGCHSSSSDSSRCLASLADLESRAPAAAHGLKVQLPANDASLSPDGTALLFRAVDGSSFLLVKTRIGSKGNYDGVLCGDRALGPAEEEKMESWPYVLDVGTSPDPGTPLGAKEFRQQVTVVRQMGPRVFAVAVDTN